MLYQRHTAHLGPSTAEAGGVVRIVGSYPPPVPPAPAPRDAHDVDAHDVDADDVDAHDVDAHDVDAPAGGRRWVTRAWAAASAVLAAAGVAAVLVLPHQHPAPSARLDVPLAVPAAPVSGTPTAPAPLPSSAPAAATPRQLPASHPVRVQIPALGVVSPLMDLGLAAKGALEVPPDAYPVGWYKGGPTPGQLGPAVLAGHVDWKGKRGAFYGLRELRAGDAVIVDRADGTAATFRVDRVEVRPKNDFPTEKVYGDIDHAGLRLITCGGAFDTRTQNYQANVIVYASLAPTA